MRSQADQQRARLEALAEQMAKDKEHEKRVAAQKKQIAAMGRQVQENKSMRQIQKQKQEEALKVAREEEKRLLEENERELNLVLLESRKAYDEEAQRHRNELEGLQKLLQL